MCLAIPGQIVELDPQQSLLAKVDVGGVRRNINVGLLESVQIGDWVLIHVGFAMEKIEEKQARDQLVMLRAMGEDQLALDEVKGYSL